MELARFSRDDPVYPRSLHACLGADTPVTVAALGDTRILGYPAVALFSSVRCPGSLIVRTFDLALALRRAGVTVIGGFHSPIERDCLELLLRGTQPVIVCLARGIEDMRLPGYLRRPLADGRLLLLSPFPTKQRRVTSETASTRNRFTAALASAVIVAYAEPESGTEQLSREVIGWGKPLYTLHDPANSGLVALGARRIGPEPGRIEQLRDLMLRAKADTPEVS